MPPAPERLHQLMYADYRLVWRRAPNDPVSGRTRGAISLSNSIHLPPSEPSILRNPVTLPPGRARFATKPEPIGSETTAKTIGMVRVCCSSAAVGGVLS